MVWRRLASSDRQNAGDRPQDGDPHLGRSPGSPSGCAAGGTCTPGELAGPFPGNHHATAGTLSKLDRRAPARGARQTGLPRGLHHRQRTFARTPPGTQPAAGTAIRNRSWGAGPDGLFPLRHCFHRRRPPPRACLQLPSSLFPSPVSALCGIARSAHYPAGTCPRLRTFFRISHHLSVRQHESGGDRLRRRAADLQHPLPVFRHALRVQALGLPSPASTNQRENRTPLLLCRNQSAQRPYASPRSPISTK